MIRNPSRSIGSPIRMAQLAALAPLVPFVLAALTSGCTKRVADNLLIVSFDTTRADRLSAYGYGHATSPSIDALARRGTLFERAFTHVPSTLPAHSSMMTSLLPPVHGVRCNGKFRLSDRQRTLAEILRGEGLVTAAIVGAFPLDARFGLAQGFDVYDDDFADSSKTAARRKGRMDSAGFWIGHDYLDFERSAEEVTDRALAWLDASNAQGRRWFLFAHYFDPHWPYEPAAGWGDRFASAYDAELAYADHHLGRLLDAAARAPGRTVIVFTADHGEGLGDHGERLHNRYLYNSTLRVPLVVELDGVVAAGRRVSTTVGHVDIMPTVLELLGVAVPRGLTGRSLVPALTGERELDSRPHYSETLVWTLERPAGIELRSILDGGFKLIETRVTGPRGPTRRVELYDLGSDMAEAADRAPYDSGPVARLSAELEQWRRRLDTEAYAVEPLELDEGARARLESLGYL